MQTFLPFPDFKKTAQTLDMRRLGKQRVECLQLLRGQWPNHPASKMWRNHLFTLSMYAITICDEWISRGYKDTCRGKIIDIALNLPRTKPPSWLGDYKFHISHQSNLLRKKPEHYIKYFRDIPDDLPYIWQV